MARVTVEDCVTVIPNRFDLCLIASARAKSILSGAETSLDRKEKPAVIALREIGDNLLDVDAIRQSLRLAGAKNAINSGPNADSEVSEKIHEQVIEDIQGQVLKEATFVTENIQVDD